MSSRLPPHTAAAKAKLVKVLCYAETLCGIWLNVYEQKSREPVLVLPIPQRTSRENNGLWAMFRRVNFVCDLWSAIPFYTAWRNSWEQLSWVIGTWGLKRSLDRTLFCRQILRFQKWKASTEAQQLHSMQYQTTGLSA